MDALKASLCRKEPVKHHGVSQHSCRDLDADMVDIYQLSRNWADLVKRARSKQLSPNEYSGANFTISNMGMYGVSTFDAILPPELMGLARSFFALPLQSCKVACSPCQLSASGIQLSSGMAGALALALAASK
eukprot:1150175-Pelagomonas_calceolata.AAC.1